MPDHAEGLPGGPDRRAAPLESPAYSRSRLRSSRESSLRAHRTSKAPLALPGPCPAPTPSLTSDSKDQPSPHPGIRQRTKASSHWRRASDYLVGRRRTVSFPRVVVLLSAVPFAGIGLAFLVSPEGMVALIGLSLRDATAQADIRAVYGGLQLGRAGFLAYCVFYSSFVRPGLVAQITAVQRARPCSPLQLRGLWASVLPRLCVARRRSHRGRSWCCCLARLEPE